MQRRAPALISLGLNAAFWYMMGKRCQLCLHVGHSEATSSLKLHKLITGDEGADGTSSLSKVQMLPSPMVQTKLLLQFITFLKYVGKSCQSPSTELNMPATLLPLAVKYLPVVSSRSSSLLNVSSAPTETTAYKVFGPYNRPWRAIYTVTLLVGLTWTLHVNRHYCNCAGVGKKAAFF